MKPFSIILIVLLFVQFAAARPLQDDDPPWLQLHTRVKIASPNQTYAQQDGINYGYRDFRTINVGAGAKLQLFRGLYGEYVLLTNLYQQLTSRLMAGIETPTSGIQFGIRYLFAGDRLAPDFDQESRDLQMYINLGGARGGLEIALCNLNRIIRGTNPADMDALTMSDVQISVNIGLWSTH